jgi:hypothetical protein
LAKLLVLARKGHARVRRLQAGLTRRRF